MLREGGKSFLPNPKGRGLGRLFVAPKDKIPREQGKSPLKDGALGEVDKGTICFSPLQPLAPEIISDARIKVGGRLRHFVSQWKRILVCPYVHCLIQEGYLLQFSSKPPVSLTLTHPPMEVQKRRALLQGIQTLDEQLVMVPMPENQHFYCFYSHVFVVPKPSGKFCLVINLKSLNKFLVYKKFSMEKMFSVRRNLQMCL